MNCPNFCRVWPVLNFYVAVPFYVAMSLVLFYFVVCCFFLQFYDYGSHSCQHAKHLTWRGSKRLCHTDVNETLHPDVFLSICWFVCILYVLCTYVWMYVCMYLKNIYVHTYIHTCPFIFLNLFKHAPSLWSNTTCYKCTYYKVSVLSTGNAVTNLECDHVSCCIPITMAFILQVK